MGCRAGADEKQDLQGLSPRALCESSPNSAWGAGDLQHWEGSASPFSLALVACCCRKPGCCTPRCFGCHKSCPGCFACRMFCEVIATYTAACFSAINNLLLNSHFVLFICSLDFFFSSFFLSCFCSRFHILRAYFLFKISILSFHQADVLKVSQKSLMFFIFSLSRPSWENVTIKH